MLMLGDGLNPLTHRLTGHISPDMRSEWQFWVLAVCLGIGVMVVIFLIGGALFVQSESCGKKSDTAAVQAGLETL